MAIEYVPAPPPETFARQFFAHALAKWAVHHPSAPSGEDRAVECLAAIDDALARLGSRTGPRADAAREYLSSARENIAGALSAYRSLGADLQGPLGIELVAAIESGRAARAAAEAAVEAASRDTVLDRVRDRELVYADGRDLDKRFLAVRDSLAFPSLPSVEAFQAAKHSTAELARRVQLGPKYRASTLHLALDQAVRASDLISKLWICFEPSAPSEAFELRAARFAEKAEAP